MEKIITGLQDEARWCTIVISAGGGGGKRIRHSNHSYTRSLRAAKDTRDPVPESQRGRWKMSGDSSNGNPGKRGYQEAGQSGISHSASELLCPVRG